MSKSVEKKILYVVNEAYFFFSHRLPVAKAAMAAGYEVHIAAPNDHVWAPADFSIDQITEEGFIFHGIPLSRRGTNPFRELITLSALWSLYGVLKPDIVHHLTIKPVIYGGLIARLRGVSAVVNHVTGLGHAFTGTDFKSRILRPLISLAYGVSGNHRNAKLIAQNSGDLALLRERGITSLEKSTLIRGSGVDLEVFAPQPEPDGVFTVILPARLIWEKGVAEFVEAARILRDEGANMAFALVGDSKASNPRSVPEEQIRKWVGEGLVAWWGRCNNMPSAFAKCHAVCLPSTYGEGVPKVLLEAAACSRAIVATNISGCREIVRDGENGFLVAPASPRAIAEALRRLASDAGLRRQMGRTGRQIVEREFSQELVVEKMMNVYRGLDGGRVC